MEARPKINLPLSPMDIKMELVALLLLGIMWVMTIYFLLKLPAIIPLHYNFSGQVDRYGNKMTLLFLPALGTVLYFGLGYLNKFPHIFNYMVKITEVNAKQQYTIATRTLRFIKLAIMLIFSFIILFIYLTTIGVGKGLGFWLLPLVTGLLLIPLVVGIIQSVKQSN